MQPFREYALAASSYRVACEGLLGGEWAGLPISTLSVCGGGQWKMG